MKIFLLALSFFMTSCTFNGVSQSFNSISKKISKYEFKSGIRKVRKDYFYDIRKKLYSLDKLCFTIKSDTLFLLESYDIESGSFYGKIWNSFGRVEYIYNNGKFNFDAEQIYTNYTCELIQDWDTTSIRLEEKINSTMIPPRNIYATRVVKIKRELKIDCILFREFFLLKRDR